MEYSLNANISHAFYIPAAAIVSEEEFTRRVRAAYPDAVEYDVNGSYAEHPKLRDMQTSQRFLHGGGQPYQVKRMFMDSIRPRLEECGLADWCVMTCYFPEVHLMSVSCHYSVKDTTIDRLIVLRQSGAHRAYPFEGGERTCSQLAEEICAALGLDFAPLEQSYMCEITKFGDYGLADEIEAAHPGALYGLLSGDEGYRFVPEELVRQRLQCQWGSRSFIRIYAFGQAFVFLNLLGSPAREAYLERQTAFGTAAYGGCDEYFFMGECPLTVNHGILFSVEFVMMLKSVVDSVIAFQSEYDKQKEQSFYKRIRATRDYRRRIILALDKVEHIGISEIGELSSVLLESQHIAPIVDKVKYLLELLEADLDLVYSERNNLLVTALTILGLIFALLQIILAL